MKITIQEALIEKKTLINSLSSITEELDNSIDKTTINNSIQSYESVIMKVKKIQSLIQKSNLENKLKIKDSEDEISVFDLIKRKEGLQQLIPYLTSLKNTYRSMVNEYGYRYNNVEISEEKERQIEEKKIHLKELIKMLSERITSTQSNIKYYQTVIERSNWEYYIEF